MGVSVLETLVVRLTADATAFDKAMGKAVSKMNETATKLVTAGAKMSLALTTPLLLFARQSVKSFSDFDRAMTESTSIMRGTSVEMRQQLEQTARTLATKSTTSAADLAKSYYYLASAGLTAKQSIQALDVVNQFSIAGAFDMARATDLLTDAQSALGLTTKDEIQNRQNMVRLGDALIAANTLANASAEQFSAALTNKSASALRLLNKDLEEGIAVLAAFADQGVKDVEAGEKLSIVLRDLQTSAIKHGAVWRSMGLQVYDAGGKMLHTADIIGGLEKALAGLSDEEKRVTLMTLGFQDRSVSAIMNLLGTSDKIKGYEEKIRGLGGIMQQVADDQMKSFASQSAILKNQLTDVMMEIAQSLVPTIHKLQDTLRSGIGWWRGLSEAQKQNYVQLGIYVGLLGPSLVLLGSLLKVVVLLTTAFRMLATAIVHLAAGVLRMAGGLFTLVRGMTAAQMGAVALRAVLLGVVAVGAFTALAAAAQAELRATQEATQRFAADTLKTINKWRSDMDAALATGPDGMAEKSIQQLQELRDQQARELKGLEMLEKGMRNAMLERGASLGTAVQEFAGFDPMRLEREQVEGMQRQMEALRSNLKEMDTSLATRKQQEEAAAAASIAAGGASEDEARAVFQLTDAIADLTKGMEEQVATLGMTASQADIWRVANMGATDAQLAAARAAADAIDTYEAEQKAIEDLQRVQEDRAREAAAITASVATPLEKYQEQISKLQDLLSTGDISQDTFTRAMAAARKEMDDAANAGRDIKVRFRVEGVEAVQAGSQAAMIALLDFQEQSHHVQGASAAPVTTAAAAAAPVARATPRRGNLQTPLRRIVPQGPRLPSAADVFANDDRFAVSPELQERMSRVQASRGASTAAETGGPDTEKHQETVEELLAKIAENTGGKTQVVLKPANLRG